MDTGNTNIALHWKDPALLADRRIADITILQAEIAAWAARTNAKQRAVDWQFTIEKARIKLKRLYPKI